MRCGRVRVATYCNIYETHSTASTSCTGAHDRRRSQPHILSVPPALPQDTPAARAEPGYLPLGSRTTLLYFLGSIPKMWRLNGTLVTANAQYSAGARQVPVSHLIVIMPSALLLLKTCIIRWSWFLVLVFERGPGHLHADGAT
jgi:hypothetical protein